MEPVFNTDILSSRTSPELLSGNMLTKLNAINSDQLGFLWIILFVFLILVLIMSGILRWHWKKYTLGTKKEKQAIFLYYLVLTILCIASVLLTAVITG